MSFFSAKLVGRASSKLILLFDGQGVVQALPFRSKRFIGRPGSRLLMMTAQPVVDQNGFRADHHRYMFSPAEPAVMYVY